MIKWNHLATADIKKMKRCNHEKLEEALAVWVVHQQAVFKERVKMICKYGTLLL